MRQVAPLRRLPRLSSALGHSKPGSSRSTPPSRGTPAPSHAPPHSQAPRHRAPSRLTIVTGAPPTAFWKSPSPSPVLALCPTPLTHGMASPAMPTPAPTLRSFRSAGSPRSVASAAPPIPHISTCRITTSNRQQPGPLPIYGCYARSARPLLEAVDSAAYRGLTTTRRAAAAVPSGHPKRRCLARAVRSHEPPFARSRCVPRRCPLSPDSPAMAHRQ